MDFRRVPVAELARQVRSREISAREVVAASLHRIESLNPEVLAFVAVDPERALAQAAALDDAVAAGGDPGPLAGVPFGVKDSEDAAGYRTTNGSTLLATAPASERDSPLVARLKAAGAVVVGKTNLPEFAWSAHSSNTLFGTTRNPWSLDHSAGGSSGGSAAAVAAGMVPLATGSDGGGSIRIPSSCCALSGLKPSHGRVPATGPNAGWLGLSSKGVLGRTVHDIVTALDAVVGPDPADLLALPPPEERWTDALADPRVPSPVAWCPSLGYAEVDRSVLAVVERAVATFEALGADVVEVRTVFDEDPLEDWLAIVSTCLLRTLEPHEGRWEEVTPVLRSMAEHARSLPALRVVRALDRCHQMRARLVELFDEFRLLVTPTTAAPPPPNALGGRGVVNGNVDPNWVRLTYPFNMTHAPAATVCAGLDPDGLPIGIQLVGPPHDDLVVLRAATALEAAIGFDATAPI